MKSLVTIVVLSLAVMMLVAQDAPSPASKVVTSVMEEFAKAKGDADEKFEKAPAVVNLQTVRFKAVERAGKSATVKLEKLMADSKKVGSDLGVEAAKQGIEDVTSGVQNAKLAMVGLDKLVVKFKGHSYLPIAITMSYADAEKLCTSLGGHLANIETKEKLEFLQKLTKGTQCLWSGAVKGKNGWHWDNNKPIDKSLWNPDSPTSDDRIHACIQGGLWSCQKGDLCAVICEWE